MQVARLVSYDYLIIVFIAAILGLPLSWWIADALLNNYIHRIDISLFWLLQPVAWILLITLLTASWQTVRAAFDNPLDSIREGS